MRDRPLTVDTCKDAMSATIQHNSTGTGTGSWLTEIPRLELFGERHGCRRRNTCMFFKRAGGAQGNLADGGWRLAVGGGGGGGGGASCMCGWSSGRQAGRCM